MTRIFYTSFQRKLRYEVYSGYFRSLPKHLQSRIFGYKRWQDAQAFFLGKVLLMECLGGFGLDVDCLKRIAYSKNGRPFLPDSVIDFNISHSGAYVICCASDRVRVGIDIEEIKPIDICDFKGQFTAGEISAITQSSLPHTVFFELWSKKEAIVKADGRGLSFPLKDIVFESDNHASVEGFSWYLEKVHIDRGLSSYLATDKRISGNVIVKELQFKYL